MLDNKEELELAKEITEEQFEPIEPISAFRKRIDKLMNEEKELDMLKLERRELEVRLNTLKEKQRIEELKNKLDTHVEVREDGKIWCDDCRKYEDPSHFD